MDSSILIPLDRTGMVPPSLSSLAPTLPLPLVERTSVSEVVAPPITRVRMQPHLGYALLLTMGLFAVLVSIHIAWGFAAAVITVANGGEITPATMVEFGAANASAVLLTLFASSCIYCVGVASIAFRGQMVERLSIRKITRLQFAAVLLLALPLAVVISSLAVSIMALVGIEANQVPIINEPPSLAIALFSIAVLPAIGEEVFFRGLLSRGLIARHGVILGVIFATGLFALVHANPVQVFVIFFMGLVMQLVFMWTRSILASVLLHGMYNGLIVIFGRNAPAEMSPEFESTYVPMVLVSLIAIAALLVLLFQTRTRWQLPDGKFWSPGYVATDMPPRELQAVAVNAKARLLPLTAAVLSVAVLAGMTYLSLVF